MTRGLRNNNPLNIRHSADQWQGIATTQTDKSFVQFQSMAYGYRAAWKILDTYCLHFRREHLPYNVRNIITRWAPPSENDTEAYIRHVVRLSGLGGYENIPRPNRYRNFERLEKTARLIAAMTCVENGIPMKEVDMDAIWKGYDLAYPGRRVIEEVEEIVELEDGFGWDEYWGGRGWFSLMGVKEDDAHFDTPSILFLLKFTTPWISN